MVVVNDFQVRVLIWRVCGFRANASQPIGSRDGGERRQIFWPALSRGSLDPNLYIFQHEEVESEDQGVLGRGEEESFNTMFYDLNVPWTSNLAELQRTLAFSAELGYNVVAVNHIIADKLPAEITNPIPKPLPFTVPSPLTILRRCTLHLSDPSQNARINTLGAVYDILALRPITEKSLAQACLSLECDIISLDLTTRFPFYFKQKTLSSALQRGIKIEMCYAPAILESDGQARRNLISNATQLIRATRGKGLVISSEARRALSLRSPCDVINLACVWGLGQEKGSEAVGREVRSAVVQAGMKRTGLRGVIDVVYGGEKPMETEKPVKDGNKASNSKNKRKAIVLDDEPDQSREKPVSKREQKRRAKRARDEAAVLENGENKEASLSSIETAPKAQIDESKTNGD